MLNWVPLSLAAVGAGGLWFMVAGPGEEPAGAGLAVNETASKTCLRLDADPPDLFDDSARERMRAGWLAACEQAHLEDPSDMRLQLALGRIRISAGSIEDAIPLFRAAAAKDEPRALLQMFDLHRSWSRYGDGRPDRVSRAEAEGSLRRAAELGVPRAMHVLSTLLDRGTIVKRNLPEAIHWAERAVQSPPAGQSRADMQVLLGRLQARSEDAEVRSQGIKLLQELAPTRGDAKAELAIAVRGADPQRARGLLEDAFRSYPGHAAVPLAHMLISGEGGPADPKRAVSLLTSRSLSDVPGVQGAYGRLLLEGKLVSQNIALATDKLRHNAAWDHHDRLLLAHVLAEHPSQSVGHAGDFLYMIVEAAELDEPGALEAVVRLKLSSHPQFADRASACALLARARREARSVPVQPAPGCPEQLERSGESGDRL